MTKSLDGKVAVVTGGGSGIGEATSVRLAADGARIAVLDANLDTARLTAALTGDGLAIHADVADAASVEAALAEVERELGPVDVWVNNAGIAGTRSLERVNPRVESQLQEVASEGKASTPLEGLVRLTDEEWREMISVHLDGTFHGTRAAARSMAARGTGAIVNVASICGLEGCAGHPHYSAAKGGILAFTRSVAKELIPQGVRVNAVAPGYIETPMAAMISETLRAAVQLATPAGRLGRPEEIAAAIAYLATDEASYVVGETLGANGGMATI
jgi:3-oxoacyl-[acyl-carrier protein] reductase